MGELVEYPRGERSTSHETATTHQDQVLLFDVQQARYRDLRLAAEVHRQVRAYAQDTLVRPGMRLADFCQALEDKNRALVAERGLQQGIAFPTGVSLNHVAAHYTPNTGDGTVLQYDDVMKVDFGVQIDGRIIDSPRRI